MLGHCKVEPKESAWYSRWSSGQIDLSENAELDVNVFDARKFVSGAMFDCEKLTWHQVVSAPFVWEDGEVRGVVAVAVSLLKSCAGDAGRVSAVLRERRLFMFGGWGSRGMVTRRALL